MASALLTQIYTAERLQFPCFISRGAFENIALQILEAQKNYSSLSLYRVSLRELFGNGVTKVRAHVTIVRRPYFSSTSPEHH